MHCSAGNLYGGIETILATLARWAGRGMEPEFALCFEGRISDELRSLGALVHVLGPARRSRPWTVRRARGELRRVLEARPFDAVVCHDCWPHWLFGPVARQAGKPLVFWLHNLVQGRQWIERGAARTPPDLALVISQCTAETLPRLFPHVPHEVLYSPVCPPDGRAAAARAAVRGALATPENATVVVMASRLEPYKGHTLLIAALGRLRDRQGWVAWIAGGAQRPREVVYLDSLRAQAGAAGIGDRVRFLGHRCDMPRVLAAADVHCQPNLGPEPFGLAFIEALYAGLPVVSTRLGGASEIVTESCGLLVPPGDPDALAEALASLFADSEARARLGSAGPARARSLCDPEAALARLEIILREVRPRCR